MMKLRSETGGMAAEAVLNFAYYISGLAKIIP